MAVAGQFGGAEVPKAAVAGEGRGRRNRLRAAARAQAGALLKWRTSLPMSKFGAVRTTFADGGVANWAYRLPQTTEGFRALSDGSTRIDPATVLRSE